VIPWLRRDLDAPEIKELRGLIQGWLDEKAKAVSGEPSDCTVSISLGLLERKEVVEVFMVNVDFMQGQAKAA